MKTSVIAMPFLIALLAGGGGRADQGKKKDVQPVSGKMQARGTLKASVERSLYVQGDALSWVDGPPGLPPGAKMARLDGDPSTPDRLFTIRLKLPANYRVMPHWHPADEHVTVLTGELRLGEGERLDPSNARPTTAGGYVVMPAKHHHFAMTTQETTIQIHGVGAWQINYVNPADDPRKTGK